VLFAVDDEGLLLSSDIAEDQVLDLVIDGVRVWSFNTSAAEKQPRAWARLNWPPALAAGSHISGGRSPDQAEG
jgi:hypothetical protein